MKLYREINKSQTKDAGLALILIFLLTGFFINGYKPFKTEIAEVELNIKWPFLIAILVLLVNMIWPVLLKPFAWFWFNLAELLGNISSRIILTVIFLLVVTPVGLFRRLLGKDTLLLKSFKKNKNSVFVQRDHIYIKEDIEQPF